VKLDTENKNALYFMPPFKMLSLDKYLSKLKKSLPEDMAETLAVSIAVQLLSGLAYIHDIQNSAHGNLCPSNILLDDEGHVAMNDYNAVREAIGASPPADLRAAQIEDLKAVERIILAITPRQNLVDDVFNGGVAPICLRQLTESEQFIKNSIIPKLQLEGALVSMEIEWTIREKMSDIVDYVEFGESIKTRIPSITTDNGFVKTLSLAADEKSAYPLRRAIGIMQRSYDIPNIIRMFAAARDGNVVHIFTEEADKGSLRQVLNRGLLPQADIPRLLLAVTAQVLNGIIYLNSKLVVSHRDISADNVLLFSSGDVKLYGFGASGKVLQLTDMVQLSHMLLELIPEGDSPELEELRALARGVAYSNPLTALRHDILNPYYNEYCKEGDETFVLLRELKAMGISGMDPMQEIESWRIWDEKNPASDERRVVREKMCKLSQERIKGATNAIRDLLAGPSSLTEPVVPK
ncbi:MAG: protein kinase, partial [Myxococcaceae bacterium]